jgi:hypothetical protein
MFVIASEAGRAAFYVVINGDLWSERVLGDNAGTIKGF